MNKQITEQIKKIKGVKTVEPHPESDRVVVTFEAEKVAVHCANKEQLVFAYEKNVSFPFVRKDTEGYVYIGGNWDIKKDIVVSCGYTIIPFTQYLSEYNLTGEWEKYLINEAERRGYSIGVKHRGQSGVNHVSFTIKKLRTNSIGDLMGGSSGCIYSFCNGKWAEIIPNEIELVDGEIYRFKDGDNSRTIRFRRNGINNHLLMYSQLHCDGDFWIHEESDYFDSKDRKLSPATKKQKQKLIRAEVKNGYFHELRSKDS